MKERSVTYIIIEYKLIALHTKGVLYDRKYSNLAVLAAVKTLQIHANVMEQRNKKYYTSALINNTSY